MPWKCSTLIIHRQTKRFSLFGFVFFFFLYHIAAAQLTILFHFLFDFTCLLCVLCDSSRYHNTPPAQTKRTHNLLNRRVNLSVCIVYLLEKSAPSVVLIVAPCTNETAIGVAWSWESDSLYFSCVFRFLLLFCLRWLYGEEIVATLAVYPPIITHLSTSNCGCLSAGAITITNENKKYCHNGHRSKKWIKRLCCSRPCTHSAQVAAHLLCLGLLHSKRVSCRSRHSATACMQAPPLLPPKVWNHGTILPDEDALHACIENGGQWLGFGWNFFTCDNKTANRD